jgi:hypothetical protein
MAGRTPVSNCSSAGRATLSRTAKSCGPGAPTLALSLRRCARSPTGRRCADIGRTTVARKPGHRPVTGEITYKPLKPLRREGRLIGRTCGSAACFLLHADHGCELSTRPSLRPLFQRRRRARHHPGATRRGNADACQDVIARSACDEAIQTIAAVEFWIASLRSQ